jgi:hypothetical protein
MSIVYPKGKDKQYAGYLFVYFIGDEENEEQIYFSLSSDGLHWNDLNNGHPILFSQIGEEGVRDPFIIRSPKEDKFFIIATDLRIARGKGWDAAQYNGSKYIIIWESIDLVNWSKERSYKIDLPNAGCVWAPEAIYDYDTEEYMIFWASMVKEKGEPEGKQMIYSSRTKDFDKFTKPKKYIERENHVIDTTIIKEKDVYYRFSKDETAKNITLDQSNSLSDENFSYIKSPILEDIKGVEGPTIFKFNDREEWCLMVDQFASKKGYLPLVTKNLASGEFQVLNPKDYFLGENKKRHGSVLNITKEEYDLLIDKWGR